jgi:hypothetical protein
MIVLCCKTTWVFGGAFFEVMNSSYLSGRNHIGWRRLCQRRTGEVRIRYMCDTSSLDRGRAGRTVELDQVGQLLTRNQQTDGSSPPRCSLDKAASFEGQDHLGHRRRRNLKVPLHFRFRRWAPVDFAVVVNERQVLALRVGIGFLHCWSKDCTPKGLAPGLTDISMRCRS